MSWSGQQPGGQQVQPNINPAGMRPQVNPSWMTPKQFEACRDNPLMALAIAEQTVQKLERRIQDAKQANAGFLQDHHYQYGQAVQNFEKLKKEHIQLNDAYNDLEAYDETLQEVIEGLRAEKHELLIGLNGLQRELTLQSIENQQLDIKACQMRAYNDSLDLKLKSQEEQIAQLDDDMKEAAKQLGDSKGEVESLKATAQNLSLQSSSLSDLRQHLDTTRVSQDRAIQALEREVQGKSQEIIQHETQLWEFKREMSGRILALQKKAQECNDELGRLQRLSEHEMNTLAAQNRALNDELKATADTLFATRHEKTTFSTAAQKEITERRDEIQQCLSVLDLVERQNAGLEASILRMMEQNKLSEKQIAEKDNINNKNLIEQTNFMSMLHMELQSAREDLFLLKARLCHHCRETILPDEAEEERIALAAKAASQPSFGGAASHAGASGAGGQLQPIEFDKSGAPMATGPVADAQLSEMQRRMHDLQSALQTAQRELLEERAQREKERRDEDELRRQEEEDRAARQLEEEARRQRAANDERKLNAGEKAETYTIRFVDGTKKKIDAFPTDPVGDVIRRICEKVGIHQAHHFYLAHSVNENSVLGAVDRFLDKNRTLEQENISPKCNLVFKFKHFKRHIRWSDIVAQEWMFRQIHQAIISDYYPVTEKLAVELASYELQSLFGDHSGKKRHSYFDRVGLDSFLPSTVSRHEFDYWQERLYQLHKQRKGLSPIDSRNRYIQTFATKSPYWGMTFFDVRDGKNRPFIAGIAEDGFYVLNATKRVVAQVLRFEHMLGWERNSSGVFIKKRGSPKATLFASTKLQSKEMVDLLNEYYMMLPQDTRDRLGIVVDQQEELRAQLPPSPGEVFENVLPARRKPMDFTSRLEYMKTAYMANCSNESVPPNRKLTQLIDSALDNNRNLEDLDLSDCDPPLSDDQWALVYDLLQDTLERFTPQTTEYFVENIDFRRLSLGPTDGSTTHLTERCIENVCNFLRKFSRLTYVNLSFIPLDERNPADVAAALVKLPDLETLILKGCKINSKGFESLAAVFAMSPSRLHTLDLEHNRLANAVNLLCRVMDNANCNLTNLNLGSNEINPQGLHNIIVTLKSRGKLQTLDISGNAMGTSTSEFADLIAASVGITALNISNNQITAERGVKITQELKSRAQLRRLDMSDNPEIGRNLTRQRQAGSRDISRDYPADFFAFLDLGSSCKLKELLLNKCEISDEAGQALASVLHNNNTLEELDVMNNRLAVTSVKSGAAGKGTLPSAWTNMLPANQHLRKLHLSNNAISFLGMMTLFKEMQRNQSIVELWLDNNEMKQPPQTAPTEFVGFLENNSVVQDLRLCNTQMGDGVLVKMGEGLRKNRSLRKIVANNNEITVRGVTDFSRYLSENMTLEFLDLSCQSVQMNDEYYLQAYKTLIDNSNLETALL